MNNENNERIEELQEQILANEQDIEQMEDTIAEYKDTIKSLNKDNLDLYDEIDDLNGVVKDKPKSNQEFIDDMYNEDNKISVDIEVYKALKHEVEHLRQVLRLDKQYLSTNLKDDSGFNLDSKYKVVINERRNGNLDLIDIENEDVVCEFQNNEVY